MEQVKSCRTCFNTGKDVYPAIGDTCTICNKFSLWRQNPLLDTIPAEPKETELEKEIEKILILNCSIYDKANCEHGIDYGQSIKDIKSLITQHDLEIKDKWHKEQKLRDERLLIQLAELADDELAVDTMRAIFEADQIFNSVQEGEK